MENKSLADKAVNIKGKQYVLVQDRVLYFNEYYAKFGAAIKTELLSTPDASRVIVKATASFYATPSTKVEFTGHSQAVIGEGMVNKTAALENAETSAVGRALAFMGIGVIESIASADEMRKATNRDDINAIVPSKPVAPKVAAQSKEGKKKAIADLLKSAVAADPTNLDSEPATKEDFEEACVRYTDLPLIESNYDAILKALLRK